MKITVDISLYPLAEDYKPAIKDFIRELRENPDLELVTNQLSTQLRGEFTAVNTALNKCMHKAMAGDTRVVFVARYINADLDITQLPEIS